MKTWHDFMVITVTFRYTSSPSGTVFKWVRVFDSYYLTVIAPSFVVVFASCLFVSSH